MSPQEVVKGRGFMQFLYHFSCDFSTRSSLLLPLPLRHGDEQLTLFMFLLMITGQQWSKIWELFRLDLKSQKQFNQLTELHRRWENVGICLSLWLTVEQRLEIKRQVNIFSINLFEEFERNESEIEIKSKNFTWRFISKLGSLALPISENIMNPLLCFT